MPYGRYSNYDLGDIRGGNPFYNPLSQSPDFASGMGAFAQAMEQMRRQKLEEQMAQQRMALEQQQEASMSSLRGAQTKSLLTPEPVESEKPSAFMEKFNLYIQQGYDPKTAGAMASGVNVPKPARTLSENQKKTAGKALGIDPSDVTETEWNIYLESKKGQLTQKPETAPKLKGDVKLVGDTIRETEDKLTMLLEPFKDIASLGLPEVGTPEYKAQKLKLDPQAEYRVRAYQKVKPQADNLNTALNQLRAIASTINEDNPVLDGEGVRIVKQIRSNIDRIMTEGEIWKLKQPSKIAAPKQEETQMPPDMLAQALKENPRMTKEQVIAAWIAAGRPVNRIK